MAPPTEEEMLRLENYLDENTPETFVVEKLVEQIIEEAPMPIEEEPETEPETIPKVEEVEIVVVEEPEIVDIVNVKPEKERATKGSNRSAGKPFALSLRPIEKPNWQA